MGCAGRKVGVVVTTTDPDAILSGIQELANERDSLLSRMATVPLDGGEWDQAHDRYGDVQGELADWVLRLASALDEVLRLTAPPAPLDVLFNIDGRPEISKTEIREAITSALVTALADASGKE